MDVWQGPKFGSLILHCILKKMYQFWWFYCIVLLLLCNTRQEVFWEKAACLELRRAFNMELFWENKTAFSRQVILQKSSIADD